MGGWGGSWMTESALEQRGSRLKLQVRPLGPWGGVRGGGYQHRSGADLTDLIPWLVCTSTFPNFLDLYFA